MSDEILLSKALSVVLPQAHLVAAFEQSLGNMTIRLKSLTLTAEQKVRAHSPLAFVSRTCDHCMSTRGGPSPSSLPGLRAQRVEEDYRAAEEAERRRPGRHQRRHQHT